MGNHPLVFGGLYDPKAFQDRAKPGEGWMRSVRENGMAMPVKLISLLGKEDMLPGWRRRIDGQLAADTPGLIRLVYNEVSPVDVRGGEAAPVQRWEAIVEGWFDSRADAARWSAGLDDNGYVVHRLVDQKLIHDSGIRPLPTKIMVTFRRRADLTRAQAQAHWRGRHVEVGLVEHRATEFLRLYYQNHVLADERHAVPAYDYDGLPEYWLDQEALADISQESVIMQAIARDEANFIHAASVETLLLREEELFARSQADSGWPLGQPLVVA